MLIKKRKFWELEGLTENNITPENVFLNRRQILAAAGLGVGGLLVPGAGKLAHAAGDPNADLYPAARNETYTLDRELTDEAVASTYNNFYEFGSHKQIHTNAQDLKIRPWQIVVDGLVNKPLTLDFDELVRKVTLEERLYRHRCVEAWSMAVPWSGFPLHKLLALVEPQADAKFVRFETFHDKKMASGQRQFWYPWPYVEGITMAEASNDLTFMVTGVYGKSMAKQFGAPVRLALPWKYGFKSIKSIVKISLVSERPVSFWEEIEPREYGFWANVNPDVPHRRWSQATEKVIGTNDRVPTLLYNGYGEQVAGMYESLKDQKLYH